MVQYNCYRCGYCTIYKKDMRLHLNRKNKCNPILRDINIDDYRQNILNKEKIDETRFCTKNAPYCTVLHQKDSDMFECDFCKKKYKFQRSLTRHLKICRAKQEQDEADANTYALVERLNQQIEIQKQTIQSQNQRIESLEQKPQINMFTNNSNNVQINIQMDKNRLDYKDTNYDVIGAEDIQFAISKAGRCIQEIIPITHFNKKHPENQNIYVSCLKSAVAMMFEEKRWNAHAWNDIADRVIDDNIVTLQNWMDLNKDNYPGLVEKFKIFIDRKEGGYNTFLTNLKRELKMVLYNNRKLIHSDAMVKLLHTLDDVGNLWKKR